MSKPYIDFAAIKAALSITQVLEHYGLMATLKRSGADALRGPCPIHKGGDPKQFSVSISKNCWHCFANDCGVGGNVLDLVARLEETDVHGAALLLNEWFGLGLEPPGKSHTHERPAEPEAEPQPEPPDTEESHEVTAEQKPAARSATTNADPSATPAVAPPRNKPLGFELQDLDAAHPYFAERGIEPQTVEHFGLGFCKAGTMSGRVVIPMHNATGDLVGYAGRWPGDPPEGRPKYKLPKGFHKTAEVFNLHRLDDNEDLNPLVIVEGFFGCMWLWQHGYHNCVALIGSSLSEQQEAAIARHLERQEAPLVELFFDEDDAGLKGRDDAARRLSQYAFVRKVILDEEGCQPDDLSPFELAHLIG